MTEIDLSSLERSVRALPSSFKGPGGAVGVVHEGRVVSRTPGATPTSARRRPMTTRTLLPICSISKQFTCGGAARPRRRSGAPRRPGRRRSCRTRGPTAERRGTLPHAVGPAGLLGADRAARRPGRRACSRGEDARPLLARMRTAHFAPGTSYSYSNGNFRMLSDLIEERCGAQPRRALCRADVRPGRHGDGGADPRHQRARRTGRSATRATTASGSFRRPTASTGPATRAFRPRSRTCWPGSAISTPRAMMRTASIAGCRRRRASPTERRRHTASGSSTRRSAAFDATGHGGALRGFRLQRLHRAGAAAVGRGAVQPRGRRPCARRWRCEGGARRARRSRPERASEPGWAGAYMDPATGPGAAAGAGARRPARAVRHGAGPADARRGRGGALRRHDAGARRRRRCGWSGRARTCARRRRGCRARRGATSRGATGRRSSRATLEIVSTGGGVLRRLRGHARDAARCSRSIRWPRTSGCMPVPAVDGCAGARATGRSGSGATRPAAVRGLTVGCWLARRVEYLRAP